MPVIPQIAARQSELTAWRRMLHAEPELGFEDYKTSAFVAERLRSVGIEPHLGIARTGVVGVIKEHNWSICMFYERTGKPAQSSRGS